MDISAMPFSRLHMTPVRVASQDLCCEEFSIIITITTLLLLLIATNTLVTI
jgi:hypothetical protein